MSPTLPTTAPPGLVVLRPPRATQALLVAIAVVFAMTMIAGGPDDLRVLINFGANLGPLVAAGDAWRLLASVFLHANWLHLVLNGWALWVLGRNLEAFYGPWSFLFLFVASALAGSIASATTSTGFSVGASGGVFGLLGASIVFAFRHRGVLPRRVVRIMGTMLLPWLALNAVITLFVPRIDVAAHGGGFVAGALLALVIRPPALEEARGRTSDAPRILASLAIALLLVSGLAAGRNLMRWKGPDGPMLDPRAVAALGVIDPGTALALASQELERTPRDPALLTARAGLLAGQGAWIEAIRDYQTALEAAPRDAVALNDFAWTLLEGAPEGLRSRSEAGRLAARALEAAPSDPYVLGTYGTWLLRSGNPEAAVGYLQRALEWQRPAAAEGTDQFLLAIALVLAGRPDVAREAFDEAVRIDPHNAYRAEAEAALAGRSQPVPSL